MRSYFVEEDVKAMLSSWMKMNEDLLSLPLEAVQQLLEAEVKGQKRLNFVLRLYGRFNRLRSVSERSALLNGAIPWETQ